MSIGDRESGGSSDAATTAERWRQQRRATLAYFDEHTSTLWGLTLVFFVAGDLFTTLVGLRFVPIVEAGPVAARLLTTTGVWLLVPLKLGTVAFTVVMWWIIPRPYNVGIPLGLAALGGLVTAWNGFVIAIVAL
ncbi:MAG: hypothetical protein PPP58_07530 [Natronomonas sp.]